MALTMVTGQVFNCCRINESISVAITRHLASLGHSEDSGGNRQAAKAHSGCHGHGVDSDASQEDIPSDGLGDRFESDEACLSEAGVTPKALQSSSLEIPGLFQAASLLYPMVEPGHRSLFAQPTPRNKSSPPLYLLTLRILV